jgi:hypothetical protein
MSRKRKTEKPEHPYEHLLRAFIGGRYPNGVADAPDEDSYVQAALEGYDRWLQADLPDSFLKTFVRAMPQQSRAEMEKYAKDRFVEQMLERDGADVESVRTLMDELVNFDRCAQNKVLVARQVFRRLELLLKWARHHVTVDAETMAAIDKLMRFVVEQLMERYKTRTA